MGTPDTLVRWVARIDRLGRRMARWAGGPPAPPCDEGVSVIVPQAASEQNLAECLTSVRAAAIELLEPVEIIVVANRTARGSYDRLRRAHPSVRWQFPRGPLDHDGALAAGLRKARCDWVYLQNPEGAMARNTLSLLAPLRNPRTFGVALEEWSTLRLVNGLVYSDRHVETPSLLQTRLLRRVLDPAVYDPLSWEDVEWNWRARKLGYGCVTCPPPAARYRLPDTPSQDSGGVQEARMRNRLLFQLRNLTTAGSLDCVVAEIAHAPETVARFFNRRRTLWQIARGRLWNHRAPYADEEVLASWAPAPAGAD